MVKCARKRGFSMKKNDYILIAVILAVAAIIFGVYSFMHKDEGAVVQISIDGKIVEEYPLDQDKTIPINDTNVLVIKDGKADMIEADCPDQICVKQKAISKNGETIVCLPNKIVVTVVSKESTGLDAVAN